VAVVAAVAMWFSLWGHLTFYLSSDSGPEQDSRQVSPPRRLVADQSWLPVVVSQVVVEAFSSHLLALVQSRRAEAVSSRLLVLVQFRQTAEQATATMVRYHWVVAVQVRTGM
jgi:hypothetical protein